MSVVATRVTDQEIVIAADSQLTSLNTIEKREDAKIFQTNGLTFGSCGYARDGALFKIFCDTRKPKAAEADELLSFFAEFDEWIRKRTNNEAWHNAFHLIVDGKAFYFNDYYIHEITDYHAIGAGRDYALGCLYLGATPEQAVEAACDLNLYCEQPITVFRIKRGGL